MTDRAVTGGYESGPETATSGGQRAEDDYEDGGAGLGEPEIGSTVASSSEDASVYGFGKPRWVPLRAKIVSPS